MNRDTEAYHWRSGKPWGLLNIAEARLSQTPAEQMNSEQFNEVSDLLSEAVKRLQGYDSRGAQAERQLGELKLLRGDRREALEHLKRAISLNPKVGVKKLIAKLETELNG